ncbi:high-potential iron-sulfur protein [Halococcus agarilyticus]|uniref:high-potential iron-sulfur protein n=1 Tax=Halococcus agarilyticus TaxID=1232219 RepID=UPI0009AE6304|nr:high-potential iron-sulfur protein [Halococcus agarilyticus]
MEFERRRRTFLRLAGSAALAALAGCSGDGGTDGNDDTTQTNADGAAGNDTTTGDEARTTTASGSTETGTATARARPETTNATAPTETTNGTNSGGANDSGTNVGGTNDTGTTTRVDDLSGPVPTAYRTASSQGGTERNRDSLQSKEAVEYQSQPKDGQQCSGCLFYLADKNGDGLGACSVVEGYIEPEAWCVSYSPYQDG